MGGSTATKQQCGLEKDGVTDGHTVPFAERVLYAWKQHDSWEKQDLIWNHGMPSSVWKYMAHRPNWRHDGTFWCSRPSVWQHVHSLFQSDVPREFDLMRPLSNSVTFSVPYGHPAATYVFSVVFSSLQLPSIRHFRTSFLCQMWLIPCCWTPDIHRTDHEHSNSTSQC